MPQTRTLQVRYVRRDQTVNAGVAKASPVTASWDLGTVVLDSVNVRVPPGPSGLAGLAILYSGVNVVPSEQPGVFLVGDDEAWEFDIGVEVSGPLTLQLYNTDIYPHTFYLRAKVRDIAVVFAGAVSAGLTVVTSVGGGGGPSEGELAGAVAGPPPEEAPPPAPPEEAPPPAAPPPPAPTTPPRYPTPSIAGRRAPR